MGGWWLERVKCEGHVSNIFRICMILTQKNRLQSIYVALLVLKEVVILEENRLGGLKWK